MRQIGLITGDRQLANTLARVLAKRSDGEVQTYDSTKVTHLDPLHEPEFFIVDLGSLAPSQSGLVISLKQQYPQAVVIAVMKKDAPSSGDALHRYGADDVMLRPLDPKRLPGLGEKLAEQIKLHRRLQRLQERLRREMRQAQIIARSKPMREILQQLPSLAASQSTVLITGETGTGKELIARAIHYLGPRAGGPFITIDCGALPENLVENELFGHARGAYTDAGPATRGLIAEAGGGTLFLDEVESLPLPVQAKFLRFLQERQFKPLGQTRYLDADVRVLAATNIDLAIAVAENRFRRDLFYRLNVVPLWIPPLRQRKSDIPALVRHFAQMHALQPGIAPDIPETLLQQWLAYDWPGNVRELENKVQEWIVLQQGDCWNDSTNSASAESVPILPLVEVREQALARCEQQYLQRLMIHTRGNISEAARIAGLNRKSFANLLKKRGIDARRFR